MQRRDLLKGSLAGLGAGLLKGAKLEASGSPAPPPGQPSTAGQKQQFSNSIREYLTREAQKISDAALADFPDVATFHRLIPDRRRQYLEMMGFPDFPPYSQRTPLNVKVTGILQRPGYRIEKLYYESIPKLYVDANLYIPTGLSGKAPAVLYVCGHEVKQKVTYQGHARRFAELGFVCLLIETLQRGEVAGEHHGPASHGEFHWYSRGYTPGGIEMLNGIRGLDLLVARPEVDAGRLGVTGMSGGGAYTWWIAAADERVKVAGTVCGTATLGAQLYDRAVDRNCDCMWWINNLRWDLAEVAALVAPRPLLISSSRLDQYFPVDSARAVYQQVKRLYTMLGAEDKLAYVEPPGQHGYDPIARTHVFSWFVKHLQGKDVSPEQVGDIDETPEHQETEAALRVFVDGPPADDRVPTIQDDIFVPPAHPQTATAAEVAEARQRLIAQLREKTFGAFPQSPPPLDAKVEYAYRFYEDGLGYRFGFTSEDGWRLQGFLLNLALSTPTPAPAILMLRNPGATSTERDASNRLFLGSIKTPCATLVVETRGTGDTAWGDGLNLHLRRASAWAGRTLASMRVYDTLRALQAIRQLPYVDGKRITLAASGEMAAVALYAALLAEGVNSLILDAPPATQNEISAPDGRGPALEMLNCLRFTDLAQVAGLLYPMDLVLLGNPPITYGWAEEIYSRLGAPGRFRKLRDLSSWQPV